MNLIWAMINDLSFIISLGLVSIPIPGIASPVQSILSTIIYMDLLMTDKWLSQFIEMTVLPEDLDEDSAFNMYFESQGFESRLILFNLGSTLVFLIIQISLILYGGIIKVMSSIFQRQIKELLTVFYRARKQYDFLQPRIFWGGTIRFIIQQFQPLLFSSLINIKSATVSELTPQSVGLKLSFSLSLILFSVTLLSIVAFFWIIKRGKAWEQRFETLIEGLNTRPSGFQLSSYWTVWTLVKWSLMCFILVLAAEYPAQQIQLLTVLSIFSTALQLLVKPQESRVENGISLFNELMASVYLFILICLANAPDDLTIRENLGLALISTLLFTLLINLLKVLITIGLEIFKRIKRKWCTPRVRKVQYPATLQTLEGLNRDEDEKEKEEVKEIEKIEEQREKEEEKEFYSRVKRGKGKRTVIME
ncbi:hypothetical protein FGO68_gene13577 [Halteria grandinella]|uniref:TRP C-terminal domain-containing protein n=1 Tax=Halteria grandinella TaxID=5974 RepID=A0A8J8T9I7_HALGN|nr:hypothetical protein FGO68_gene13577 [Halteria grandinella]